MNSRQLWNSHQRHKFLRAKASRDILEFRVSEMPFPGVFKRYFSTVDSMLLHQDTRKTGNNAVAQFERFTDLNLFKYAFNVIHNHYWMVLIFWQPCIVLLECCSLTPKSTPGAVKNIYYLYLIIYSSIKMYFLSFLKFWSSRSKWRFTRNISQKFVVPP